MEKQDFITSIKDGAIQCMKQYKILASLTIAQAILESGWGTSELSVKANNLFGIKRWGYTNYITLPTTEYVNGQPIIVNADFRKYSSWSESINDHAAFLLENSRYSNLIGCTDYIQACQLIKQDGYATDPNYANTLIQIVKENNLNQYDVIYQGDPIIKSFQHACNLVGVLDENGNPLAEDGYAGVGGHTRYVVANKVWIHLNSTGELVKWLQNTLISKGFSCGSYGVDGSFGYDTLTAVQHYQAKNNLVPDGSVGKLTLTKLLGLQ